MPVKYVQVVADASAGAVALRPGTPDEAAADLLNAASLLIGYLAGHGKCGPLGYDRAAMTVSCDCGGLTYRLSDPVQAVGAVAS